MAKGNNPALKSVGTPGEEPCLGTEQGAYLLCVYLQMNLGFLKELS